MSSLILDYSCEINAMIGAICNGIMPLPGRFTEILRDVDIRLSTKKGGYVYQRKNKLRGPCFILSNGLDSVLNPEDIVETHWE